MKRWLGLLAGAGIGVFAAMGPALACLIPLPKMTPADVEQAGVAFVGTVKGIEERGVEILDAWPELMACQRIILRDEPMCPADHPVTVAVFDVEEAIHGVVAGEDYFVPQGQGSDCATPYEVGVRYLFGSTGINGQVWVVDERVTAAQALAEWETLPQYFDDRRYKPGEEPWLAFAENAETSLADESYRGIEPRVLALLIGVLRWEQDAPEGLKVSDLRLTSYNRSISEYEQIADPAALDWTKLDAVPALTICGTFEVAGREGSKPRAFAYTPGSTLTFSQSSGTAGGSDGAGSSDLPPKLVDGLLQTWGCLEDDK